MLLVDPEELPDESDPRADWSFLRPSESASFVTASRMPAIGDAVAAPPSAGAAVPLALWSGTTPSRTRGSAGRGGLDAAGLSIEGPGCAGEPSSWSASIAISRSSSPV